MGQGDIFMIQWHLARCWLILFPRILVFG